MLCLYLVKDLREMLPYMDSDVTMFSDYLVIQQTSLALQLQYYVSSISVRFCDSFTQLFVANRTIHTAAHSMVGCWRDTAVCLSVCPSVCDKVYCG